MQKVAVNALGPITLDVHIIKGANKKYWNVLCC